MNATTVWLDFDGSPRLAKLLGNISAIVSGRGFLWTASDEGRTVECLEPVGTGWLLKRSFSIDGLLRGVPGRKNADEADIESLDFVDGRLWISGSHCSVRRKAADLGPDYPVSSTIEKRPSRRLLGSVEILENGTPVIPGVALPFRGKDTLRAMLAGNPHIQPFVDLPTKENGLDVEGIAVIGNRAFLGLRGPVIAGCAIVVEASLMDSGSRVDALKIHFLDLSGLGIRDLSHDGDALFVLAGPAGTASTPFRLYRWTPQPQREITRPACVYEWPVGDEHPEGMCALERDGKHGLLVVYDSPSPERVRGSRYAANWFVP